jgi:hypothetical protein
LSAQLLGFTYPGIYIFTAKLLCANLFYNIIPDNYKGDATEMIKDDTKEQIPLFDVPVMKKEKPHALSINPAAMTKKNKTTVRNKTVEKEVKSASSPARTKNKGRNIEKVVMKNPQSGQVPEGDVRLTANIREDLHLKLKIAAARRRTTIGELLEEMVEKYI